MKRKLLGMTLEELRSAAVECGLKSFVGNQLCDWIYSKRVTSLGAMRNISAAARERLSAEFDLGVEAPLESAVSSDGTAKYLFATHQGLPVESVTIPDADRLTLCVSSQAGCRMGCKFCMTGRQGWKGNLDTAQILNQFISIPGSGSLTNAVFMGMGEPLDNYEAVSRALPVLTAPWGFGWSPKRITLSTVGVLPVLERFLREQSCHLAISLHNPFQEECASMMPARRGWDIDKIMDCVRRFDWKGQRRLSFEYTVFDGWNDDKVHADALIRLLKGLECRVNLIRFHRIPDFPFGPASPERMEAFRDRLNNNGIICTIRASRGEDIFAACGLLSGTRSQS